ncbi:MAG: DUF1598 domain-containing protein [Pirellulales bacterium]|nr:DUF1598 domain-containing protein [Pirellulales bacterium]
MSLGLLCLATAVHAGVVGGGFGRRSVGGVMIDGAGVVRAATVAERRELANLLREATEPAAGEMAEPTEMRMISLKGLQEAITQSRQTGRIPSDIEFLAGLQRIEYVFVDKEKNDIVIAGPAEPWKLREDGSVVGKVTGGSTMRLADLVVAFGSVESARNGGISCSIEPTPEGHQRLQKLLRSVKLRPGQNPAGLEASMKQAFGPQMIHLHGIPTDSRYARTLVAADFEMKRVAMGLIPSPVDGLPSYLQMSRNSRHGAGENPRWWMACNYEALTRSEDGLAWKLSGQGVKTMTEQDIVERDGTIKRGKRTDKLAQDWADKMNNSFYELSREIPVFADLQNIMDMTVVATLITQERLAQQAGLDLSVLNGQSSSSVELASYDVPRSVAPQCSFIRGRSGWVVTASGGVDVNAFEVVDSQKTDASVADSRTTALAGASNRWWWNK